MPPSRPMLFLFGAVGMVVAVVLAVLVESLLSGDAHVSSGFFAAAAALTPVVGLGLLVQLLGVLAGRTRGLLRELRRFNEEMASDEPELSLESQRERRVTWERTRDFVHVLGPFVTGLVLQLVVTEAVAIYCLIADVDERVVALAVGIEIFALFNYLLFFSPMLTWLGGRRSSPGPAA